MMTVREAVKYGKDILDRANIDNSQFDSLELMFKVNGMDKTGYLVYGNEALSEDDFKEYDRLIGLRSKHVPLQHILGKAYFYGLEFKVNENVLIPRPDTEILVENVLKLTDNSKTVIDMCTGSGCIILSLAVNAGLDKCSEGKYIGVDISNKALEVASYNAEKLGLSDVVQFIHGDLFENVDKSMYNSADVIVSNPPYIPSGDIEELQDEVKIYDPRLALDGHDDGLFFYGKITAEATKYLKSGGFLCYETGYNQAPMVSDILSKNGFTDIRVIKDLAGLDRVVIGMRHL